MANLNKEVWVGDINATLERDAAFLSRMKDISEFVENEYINIPNSGEATQVFKNANTFPLTPAQRTDSNTRIKMDQYSTQPFLVTDLETAQLSYSKRDSIMGQHARKLVEHVGDSILQTLATGVAPSRTVTVAGSVGYAEMLAVAKVFDQENILSSDRHIELPTDMYYELLADETVARQLNNGFGYSVVEGGRVLEVAGIKIHQRPQVATLNAAAAGLAYQKDTVGVGRGPIDMMSDFGDNGKGNPLYLGGLMSAIVWMGAGRLRQDNKGVVTLVRA